MRKVLLIGTVLILPMNAMAQTAAQTAQTVQSLAEGVPTPRLETTTTDSYRVAAIAAGAVVGVIVANYLTGGLITPVLLWGAGDAGMVAVAEGAVIPAVAEGAAMAVPEAANSHFVTTAGQALVTAAGGMIGGYFGNWAYGN
jgi:uncharacterized membrane protein YfcA